MKSAIGLYLSCFLLASCVNFHRTIKPTNTGLAAIGEAYVSSNSNTSAEHLYRAGEGFLNASGDRHSGLGYDAIAGINTLKEAASLPYGTKVADAQYALGHYYMDGIKGVLEPDYTRARYWLERAAMGNKVSAFQLLQALYSEEKYGFQDRVEACKWIQVASERYPEDGEKRCKKLQLDAPQIAEAKKRARVWKDALPKKE